MAPQALAGVPLQNFRLAHVVNEGHDIEDHFDVAFRK